jgi:hypothetical protein
MSGRPTIELPRWAFLRLAQVAIALARVGGGGQTARRVIRAAWPQLDATSRRALRRTIEDGLRPKGRGARFPAADRAAWAEFLARLGGPVQRGPR